MKVTRLYTGSDGESHFEDIDVPLHDGGRIGQVSELIPAKGLMLRETAADYNYEWHTAPRRQYIIILKGGFDVEIGDGTVRRFLAGDMLLVEDTTGRGHCSRNINNEPRLSVFVTLE